MRFSPAFPEHQAWLLIDLILYIVFDPFFVVTKSGYLSQNKLSRHTYLYILHVHIHVSDKACLSPKLRKLHDLFYIELQ